METKRIIIISLIAAVVIAAIIFIYANWKKWFPPYMEDTIEKDQQGNVIEVNESLCKSLMNQLYKEYESIYPVSNDLLKSISILNGQDLKFCAQYFKTAYNKDLYDTIDNIAAPLSDYDEEIMRKLKLIGNY